MTMAATVVSNLTPQDVATNGVTFPEFLGQSGQPANGSGIIVDNVTTFNRDTKHAGDDWSVFKWIKLTVAIIVTILIIINNIINLIVLPQMKDMGKRMKILLYSLSLSDICLGITVCLPSLASGALGYWPFKPALCQVSGTMNGVGIGVSLWSLTAISIERYVLIRKPLHSNKNQGMVYLWLGLSFIWTFSITFFAFPIFLERNLQYYVYDDDVITCSFRWKNTAYFLVAKLMYPVLSGSIIFFNNIMIHSALKKAKFDRLKWKAQMPLTSPSNVAENSTSKIKQRFNSLFGTKSTQPRIIEPRPISIGSADNTNIDNDTTQSGNTERQQNGIENSSLSENHSSQINSIGTLSQHQNENDNIIMTRSMMNRNMKARLLLVLTSLLFFTTTAPYMLTSLIDHFMPESQIPAGIKFAALWMLNTNSFVNFYVYSFIYTEFRKRYRALLSKLLCWNKKRDGKNTSAGRNRPENNDDNLQDISASSTKRLDCYVIFKCSSNRTFVSNASSNSFSERVEKMTFDYQAKRVLRLVPRDDAFPPGSVSPRSTMNSLNGTPSNERSVSLLGSLRGVDIKVVPTVDV